MNNNFFSFNKNLNPQVFAWLACIIASAFSNNYSALEQNTLGNWLTLVGQFLETTAAQQQLINSKTNDKTDNSFFFSNFKDYKNEIDYLLKAINNLQNELENLKKCK